MKLLIAIPSNIGRSVLPAPFCTTLAENMLSLAKEGIELHINYFGGLRIDAVRINMILYAQQIKADAIVMLDDDMAFPPNAILRLVEHYKAGRQVISGVYGAKTYPFHAFIMPIDSQGFSGANWLREYEPKLYEVKTIATGILLIDMKVFDHLSLPWFLLRMDQYGRITYTEDCFFGMNCFNNGVKMYVDGSIQCQHLDLVGYPKLFSSPYITYGEPQMSPEGEVTYPRKPTYPPKQPAIIDDVWLKEKVIHVHPKEGYYYSDGLDECEHQHQTKLPTNAGEPSLYKCHDCGLIVNMDKEIDQLEQNSQHTQPIVDDLDDLEDP